MQRDGTQYSHRFRCALLQRVELAKLDRVEIQIAGTYSDMMKVKIILQNDVFIGPTSPPCMYTLTGNLEDVRLGSNEGGMTIFTNRLYAVLSH